MNNIIKLIRIVTLTLVASSAYAAAPAQVAATGETGGAVGSDSGVPWPSPRFVAGSGVSADCITDKLTGLMWPKNAIIGFVATSGGPLLVQPSYTNTNENLNKLSWVNALTAIANMNSAPNKLCGYSDWRLPNKVELLSITNYGEMDFKVWMNTQGFLNVQTSIYWSSTAYPSSTLRWSVSFYDGSGTYTQEKTTNNYIWPVRGGQ